MIHELKPYPAYRDSGESWPGMIPEHWMLCRVVARAEVVNGYPFDSALFGRESGYPLVRIRDLNKNTSEVRYGGAFVESARVEPGELLIGMDGDFNVGTWFGVEPALLNQRMCRVRGRTSEVTAFLRYALPFPLKAINDITWSTTVKHLSSAQVERVVIAFPPLPEQSAIVHFLGHVDRRIRRYIRSKQKLIALLDEQRQAIIHRAVTRGLDPNVGLKPSGVEWLGDVPRNWDVAALRHRYSQCLGKMLDTKRILGVHSLPYLRNVDVQWDRISTADLPVMDIAPNEYQRYTVRCGDLLVCEGGEVGRGAIWNGELARFGFQKALHRLRPLLSERDLPRFLLYALRVASKAGAFDDGHQSTIAHLTGDKLRAHRFAFPPIAEQVRIVAHLDRESGEIDRTVMTVGREISLLREYRTRLISDVVTGKLDVREAAAHLPEETDEPEPLDETDTLAGDITEAPEAPDPDALEEAEA